MDRNLPCVSFPPLIPNFLNSWAFALLELISHKNVSAYRVGMMIYCPGTLTKWRIYNPPAARGVASRLPSAVSPLRGPPPLKKAALPRSNLLPGQPASQMIHECVRALALIRNNLKIIPAPGLLIGWAEAFEGTTTQPNFSLCLALLSSLGWSQEHVLTNT